MRTTRLWSLAVRRVEQCLRPEDRMCPVGMGRIVVCFGHGAQHVSPDALGTRLARALGDHLSVGTNQGDLSLAVGVATGSCDVEPASVASEALAAIRPGTSVPESSVPTVVVSTLGSSASHAQIRVTRRHQLDTVLSLVGDMNVHAATAREAAPHSDIRILIAGPPPASGDEYSPAVEGVLAVTARLGITPLSICTGDPRSVVTQCRDEVPDVVVIPLRLPSATFTRCQFDSSTPWELWSQLTRELVQADVTVWAVGVGAPVAAVAACVKEGARGILDLWDLADALEKLGANLQSRRLLRSSEGGRAEFRVDGPGLPAPYDALVELTAGEHRVLYQMMHGVSAGDIAKQLVVSLATVRSHIRSILRKLGVSSQLAAVALANGAHTDPLQKTS